VATTYIALLNCKRPLIKPDSTHSADTFVIPPMQTGERRLLEINDKCLYEVLSSDFSSLASILEQARSSSVSRAVIVVFSETNIPSGVWIFKDGSLAGSIPFGITASLFFEKATFAPLESGPKLLGNFLRDYIAHQIRLKTIFTLTSSSKDEIVMAALIRSLSESLIIYGKASDTKLLKQLKKFSFLTHDLPRSKEISLRDIYIKLLPVIERVDLSELILPKFTRQISKWKLEKLIN
jgi:hypothetical protein